MPLGYRTQLLQKLRDILDLVGERLRPLGVLGVVTQQVSVILHRRAAPSGVDHHVVKVLLLEGVYGFSGEAERLLLAPSMRAKSAAAALVLGRDDLAAFGGEDPNGRGVDLLEEDLLHASGEDADPLALFAAWGGLLGDLLFLPQSRHEGLHRPHASRKPAHDPGLPELLVEAEALVEAQGTCGEPEAAAVGEELEDHLPKRLVLGGALVAALDLGACSLYELVVLHTGGAGGYAGHAPQAQVKVPDHRVVHRLFGEALVHEVDAPARGVHLLAEEHVCRAGRQTEAAVDTVVDEALVGRMMVVKSRKRHVPALGASLAHGLFYGPMGRGAGTLADVLRAAGAYGLRHSLIRRWPRGVAAPLGGRGRVVAVAGLARVRGPSWGLIRTVLFGHLDTSHKAARVKDAPGIKFLLYPAREAKVIPRRPPHLYPLFQRDGRFGQDNAPTPPNPDLPELLDDPGLRLFGAAFARQNHKGDASPGMTRDARRYLPTRAGPEHRVQDTRKLRRRSPYLYGDLVLRPGGAGASQGSQSVSLFVAQSPRLPKGPEEEIGRLRLRLNGGGYTLDKNSDQPGLVAPVQLKGARDELGVHDGLRRLSRRDRVRKLDGDGAGCFGPRVQPEVARRYEAERAQRTCKELGEVVASHVLDDLTASLRHHPVRKHYLNAYYQVPHGPVAKSPGPGGVGRDNPAHRRPLLRRVDAEHLLLPDEVALQVF